MLDPFRGEANGKGTGVQTGELLAFTYNRFKVIQRIKINLMLCKRLIIINDVSAEFELSHILKNFQSKKFRARNMCLKFECTFISSRRTIILLGCVT